MSHTKQPPKQKRRRRAVKVVPILGLTGLSLSLVNAASASVGVTSAAPVSNPAARQAVTLSEQEITDVNLATFYVFDKDNAPAPRPRRTIAFGCGACAGCGCGGGCWTGQYLTPLIGGDPPPPYRPVRPVHRHGRALKHAQNPDKR
jgi:hypothetical protein